MSTTPSACPGSSAATRRVTRSAPCSRSSTSTVSSGSLRLNGEKLDGFYTVAGNPWQVDGVNGTSATDPLGIKVGGSFPQDTLERNPCNCRTDALMFLDRAVSAKEVQLQYDTMAG